MLSYSNSRDVYSTCIVRAVFLCRPFKFKDRHINCHVFEAVKRPIFVYVFCYFACLKKDTVCLAVATAASVKDAQSSMHDKIQVC